VLSLDLGFHVGVAGGDLVELDEVAGALTQVAPCRDLGAQGVGLAEDALGGARVVPEVGPRGLLVEGLERLVLAG
jgi:hypothetical protein